MDELTLDDKKYLSSKRAAQVTGYAKDYVGQLCREGRVEARLVGRNWYILESSILEHRFGAEEKTVEAEPVTPEELEKAWETPKYSSEPLETVPTLAPKPFIPPPVAPVPAENQQVLADMQSAWKEWFDREEKTLPDASSMLLDDHEAVEEAPEAISHAHEEHVHEEFFPVHIDRHAPVDYQRAPAPQQRIMEREEAISRPTYDVEEVEAPRARPVRTSFSGKRPSTRRKGTLVLRSALLSLAGLAIIVAFIGSGVFDGPLAGTGGSFITDFIAGIQKVSK